jgi:hypothetical protein
MPLRLAFLGLIVLSALAVDGGARADESPTPEQTAFFEAKVRPLLAERCFGCHGAEKQKSGLRLDSRAAMLAGGDAGPAVEPGKPEASLLIDAINYQSLQMPPDRRLSAGEVAVLTQWVKEGAYWPNQEDAGGPVLRKKGIEITDEDRRYWAFQPVKRPSPPMLSDDGGSQNPIDVFLRAKLAEKGLAPSPPADPRTRLRRLSFDLLGLPVAVEEVEAFAAETAPDAYERVVDAYLANPAYGERWGRHWLDLVRFAQTNGYERDDEKPHVWRYRDYVISSLNADKPYHQFVREQLAGDELEHVTDETIIATGFYRLGVWDDEPDDARQAEFDELDDILSTTGSVFLGMTLGCARCHDHKFDPLSQDDYYSLLAFVRNVKRYVKPDDKGVGAVLANLSGGGQALAVFEQGLTPQPVHVLARGNAATPGKEVSPRFPLVFGADVEAVTPTLPAPPPDAKSLGRRRIFADWLTDGRHPLTARVIVNRLWHHHFGKGLVPTPSDFGHTGLPCSHPELLDYLAAELVDSGWSLKRIHRMIVTSAAYQQSSRSDRSDAIAMDPGNALLWRQNLRRLEAEAIRDATLAVSGQLNREMGGRGIFPELSAEVLSTQSRPGAGWDKSPPAQQHRRSVYIFVKRTLGVPMLESFDVASPDTSQATRTTTTIAPQALILLNGTFSDEQADAFARSLLSAAEAGDEERIGTAFRRALARPPSEREMRLAREFLDRQRSYWNERPVKAPEIARTDADSTALSGWTAFGGRWTLSEPGACCVEPAPGAKIVRDDIEFADGVVECHVRLDQGGDGGLLLRITDAMEGTDTLKAYNVNFTPTQLRLGKHVNNWRELTSASVPFPPETWVSLRVHVEGGRIRIHVNGADQPSIDFVDAEPLPAGKLGLRTFMARASFRDVKVRQGGVERAVPFDVASREPLLEAADVSERRAWSALCKILLNLNEFVYVD